MLVMDSSLVENVKFLHELTFFKCLILNPDQHKWNNWEVHFESKNIALKHFSPGAELLLKFFYFETETSYHSWTKSTQKLKYAKHVFVI